MVTLTVARPERLAKINSLVEVTRSLTMFGKLHESAAVSIHVATPNKMIRWASTRSCIRKDAW